MPKRSDHSRLRTLAPLLALWLVVLVAYWNALSVPFVWDDHHFVGEDSQISRGATSTAAALAKAEWVLDQQRRVFGPTPAVQELSRALESQHPHH